LANHKSALKRIRQTRKRTIRNRYIRGTMRSFVKRVRLACEAGDKAAAQEALLDAVKKIDKASSKGVIHRNHAARRVSRLTQAVNKLG
jgi:small subunit ribosomal protein S20